METSDVDGNDGESDRGSDCDGDSEWESYCGSDVGSDGDGWWVAMRVSMATAATTAGRHDGDDWRQQ